MMTRRHVLRAFLAALALGAVFAARAQAQTGQRVLDVNQATESELRQLPHMDAATAARMIERRPFKTIMELHRFLLDQKLSAEQAREFYRHAFVPINLNTGARDEFLLIPGVGSRMSAELMEYRPWKNWAQFDKEISKYVGQQETDRIKQYVFIPPD